MAVANRPSSDSVPEKQQDGKYGKNKFDVVVEARRIEVSNQLVGIKSALQKIGLCPEERVLDPPVADSGCGFKFMKSIYPIPEGILIFKLPNVSKVDQDQLSEQQQIGNFMWRVLVMKQKKKFDDDEKAGCFLQCASGIEDSTSLECRASFRIILKSSKHGGQDFIIVRSTNNFRLKTPRSKNWGRTFRLVGLNWKALVEKGLIENDTLEIIVEVKVES